MSTIVTRSRTLSEASSQKQTTRKKTGLTKTAFKRKSIIETSKKKPDAGAEKQEKQEKQKGSRDESSKKNEAASSPKRPVSGTSKRKSLQRMSIRQRKNYISQRRLETSMKGDKSVKEETSERTDKPKKVRDTTSKVLKKRRNVFQEESINKSPTKMVRKTRRVKKTVENDTSLRQMSLKESFSNQSKRPPTIAQRTKSNDNTAVKKPKVPIYKSVPLEESVNNPNKVYDFNFDANDTRERIRKKKKRIAAKKTRLKTIKRSTVDKKVKKKVVVTLEPVEVEEKVKANTKDGKTTAVSSSKEEPGVPVSKDDTATVVIKTDAPTASVSNQDAAQSNMPEVDSGPPVEPQSNVFTKPTVRTIENLPSKVSVVNVSNNNTTTETDDFRPFRPTNVFHRFTAPNRSMVNHSLLEKSLSPIAKLNESFDPGSPWRPPPLTTFSQVKSLFQSTPQQCKVDITSKRTSHNENDSKGGTNTIETKEVIQKNSENIKNAINQKKGQLASQRRFGRVITNLEHSVQSESIGQISGRILNKSQSPTRNAQSINSIRNTNNLPEVEDKENKENMILNYQTPKKTLITAFKRHKPHSPLKENMLKENVTKRNELRGNLQKVNPLSSLRKENVDPQPSFSPQPGPSGLQKSKSPRHEPLNVLKENKQNNIAKPLTPLTQRENIIPRPGPSGLQSKSPRYEPNNTFQENTFRNNSNSSSIMIEKENVDPQPGVSGLKSSKSPRNDQRVLRQSNLNNFLNLEEMPESTVIKTRHGIFDDNYTTPISNRVTKKSEDRDTEIKNAFGFIEGDDDSIMPAQQDSPRVMEKLSESRTAPVRLPVKDIRNHLLRKTVEEKIVPENKVEIKNTEVKTSPEKRKEKKIIDVTNFSDTFDILSETECSETSTTLPLFADLEPSHFTQPPKRLYKRKRGTRFNFTENDEEESDSDEKHYMKRKKTEKMNKQDEKRLREWVKTVNRTFEEIDHFDLVVE